MSEAKTEKPTKQTPKAPEKVEAIAKPVQQEEKPVLKARDGSTMALDEFVEAKTAHIGGSPFLAIGKDGKPVHLEPREGPGIDPFVVLTSGMTADVRTGVKTNLKAIAEWKTSPSICEGISVVATSVDEYGEIIVSVINATNIPQVLPVNQSVVFVKAI